MFMSNANGGHRSGEEEGDQAPGKGAERFTKGSNGAMEHGPLCSLGGI